MKSKAHKNKDSPQNCVDSDAVKPEKIKFPLYLHPDTMQQVETLYKADNCTSKTEFLEKAVRFYCGYLQSKNAADFLAPELASMLDGIVKGTEQRLSRGLFKVAVELGAVTHMLAAILSICRILNDQQINRQSKSGIWRKETVRYILSNEAYIGDRLWRKKYTANQFPFQKRENHGEIPQYYCKNHHPAIVNEATFEAAQKLIAEKSYDREKPEKYPLTCKIECADCGTKWMRCVRRGKVYWVCRKHKERAADCAMKPVPEQAFFDAFLRFFHKLKQNYNHIFPPCFPNCKP